MVQFCSSTTVGESCSVVIWGLKKNIRMFGIEGILVSCLESSISSTGNMIFKSGAILQYTCSSMVFHLKHRCLRWSFESKTEITLNVALG